MYLYVFPRLPEFWDCNIELIPLSHSAILHHIYALLPN